MHPALVRLREALTGTPFEGQVWLVGGAVRDELLGRPIADDLDLVTTADSAALVHHLHRVGLAEIPPVTYERFGTAMIRIGGVELEFVTARRESYRGESRKPDVEPGTLLDDARRRDFTANALLRDLWSGEVLDILGTGVADLRAGILRTPLDPLATFADDPLRMLRAVRFRWKLGFRYAEGLADAIGASVPRLEIVSAERVRDEFAKILSAPTAAEALDDLMNLGLMTAIIPETGAMVGCEQGKYHHADVWGHTVAVVRGTAPQGDLMLNLAALFHDVGKPATRQIDEKGDTRFFGHELVGADLVREILRRLRFPDREIADVAQLVRHHMRLGTAGRFSATAARRLIRDLGPLVDPLLDLVEADKSALRPGVATLDLDAIRAKIGSVGQVTPKAVLVSPLDGREIASLLGLEPGKTVGKWKDRLTEAVLDGEIEAGDKEGARAILAREAG